MTNYVNPVTRVGGVEQIVVPERAGTGVEDAPFDGTPYVREDGEWVPLPDSGGGGGGAFPISAAETISNVLTGSQKPTGEGGIIDGSIVWEDPLDPWTFDPVSWLTVLGSPYAGSLGLVEEGWFDVRIMCYFKFPPSTGVTYVKAHFTVGTGYAGQFEAFQGPVIDYAGNKVFQFELSLGPIYSDGNAMIQPSIRWNDGIVSATTAWVQVAVTRIG